MQEIEGATGDDAGGSDARAKDFVGRIHRQLVSFHNFILFYDSLLMTSKWLL